MQPKLTLLFDPLCGWCYGAHPALNAVDAAFQPEWTLLPTGLFARPQSMNAEKAAYFWQNDQRIAELTGQVFSTAYRDDVLANHALPFDSTTATQAWIRIATANPTHSLAALSRIQALRYKEGMTHSPAKLAEVAAEFGLNAATFENDLHTGWPSGSINQMMLAQSLMQQHRLQGVPSLLLNGRLVPSHLLYQTQDLIDHIAAHTA
ncbi:DsbA family protein [Chitinimonas sp. PSY-7]|uniref:DsbA family protein n=1 Tax=Chitinimonas sp. PSY-7 TaxID=3459088 RepID=UPI00404023BE